jgi:hypothetical protein
MFDVSSRAKLSVSALAERKIASARPRKYGLLLRAEEEMLLYGQALARAGAPAAMERKRRAETIHSLDRPVCGADDTEAGGSFRHPVELRRLIERHLD